MLCLHRFVPLILNWELISPPLAERHSKKAVLSGRIRIYRNNAVITAVSRHSIIALQTHLHQDTTMSLPPAPYTSQPSSYPTNYRPQNPPFNSETPPPPPPKPSSHEASRRGTPQTGPPLPPPPPTSLSHEISLTQQAGFPNSHTSDPTYQDQQPPEPTPQIQPPNIEDGWIPDILKDKS